MTIETVEAIGAADRQRAVASLTLAFASDPVMRWGWSDQERYLAYWPRVTDAFGGGAFDHSTAYGLEDCRAVALWLSPGVGPDGETALSLMRESMDGATFEDFNGVFEQMDEFHPTDDHWYLPFTGVDPIAQGRGLGATLLRHALTRCDATAYRPTSRRRLHAIAVSTRATDSTSSGSFRREPHRRSGQCSDSRSP